VDGEPPALVERLLAGDHRALARTISKIEDRSPGYRDLVRHLHAHTGRARVVGVTGAPGAGKSTLVDKLTERYREEGLAVGVIAIDPASPFTGGSVLGDRIRMASTSGDMDTFVRSMSARGRLGGLSTATADAVTALDAFGKDVVIVETVGAGQNEVDVVRTADTVAVLVPPGSGDDVQMLKAGILEIGDVFVVNKADTPGADRTVRDLREMVRGRHEPGFAGGRGEDGTTGAGEADDGTGAADWEPSVLETVATTGEGLDDLVAALRAHADYLDASGRREARARQRYAAEIRTLLREDVSRMVAEELDRRGGLTARVERVLARETDPYTVAEEVLAPVEACLEERTNADRGSADGGDDTPDT